MILYADNPHLGLKTVTTIQKDVEYRRNCKCIKEKYYVIDRDCFLINERWYRTDGGNIVFDYEKKVWVHKDSIDGMVKGIVGFTAKGEPEIGYFTVNDYKNVPSKSRAHGNYPVIDQSLVESNGYFEDPSTCTWYKSSDLSTSEIRQRKMVRNERSFTDRGYNIEDNDTDFRYKTKMYKEYDLTLSKKAKEMAKFIGDLTFGCEIEIYRGNLPNKELVQHGIVICRDGSIDGGPELVTIPLAGAKGLQNVVEICRELKGRSTVSIACAFHVHFGNVRRDKLFLAAFYQLCRKVQDELFTAFPFYKTEHKGIKKKNYNQKLQKLGIHPLVNKDRESYDMYLEDSFIRIFDFLAEGKMDISQFNKKTREHPIRQKWDRHSRYYWANLLNMFFGNRNTIEFRLHGPTTNSHKIINWMFICVALIRYAENNALDILTNKNNISIKSVLGIFAEMHPTDPKSGFLGDYLYAYFESRRAAFAKDYKNGDVVSMWDIEEDEDYEFSYNGQKGLV